MRAVAAMGPAAGITARQQQWMAEYNAWRGAKGLDPLSGSYEQALADYRWQTGQVMETRFPTMYVGGPGLIDEVLDNGQQSIRDGYIRNFQDLRFWQGLRANRQQWVRGAEANEAARLAVYAAAREQRMRAELREVTRQMEASIGPMLIPGMLGRLAGPQLPSWNDNRGFDFTSVLLNDTMTPAFVGSASMGSGGTYEWVPGEANDKATINVIAMGASATAQTNLATLRYSFAPGESPVDVSMGFDFGLSALVGFRIQGSIGPRSVNLQLSGSAGVGTHWSVYGVSVKPGAF